MIANRFDPLEPPRPGVPVRARDRQTAQTVVLRPVGDLDARLVGVCHPALLTIFDIVVDGGRRLAACEFVESRSLRAVMGGQPCHPRRAAEIVSEIADGVAELHGRGLSHGAISQDSVFLTSKGKSKLQLADARAATDAHDLDLLRRLLAALTGAARPDLASVQSAAVLAATLRHPS